jgi:hypothetical protein
MDLKGTESEQSQWPKLSFPPASASFLLGLLFNPENGGDMSLHKVRPSPKYMIYIQEVHTPLGSYYEENLPNLYKLIYFPNI